MTCIAREEVVIAEGETELVRVDAESADSESWLEKKSIGCISLPSKDLGLSFPVGPLPNGGRSSGGQPTIFLRRAFSSSSSDTLCSRDYLQKQARSEIE